MNIGDYTLEERVADEATLIEISGAEALGLKKTFQGEQIRKAPRVRFLGVDWHLIVGTIDGRIHKLSAQFSTERIESADGVFSTAVAFCSQRFGEPAEHPSEPAWMWATPFGNVVMDRQPILGSHVINVTATSGRLVRAATPITQGTFAPNVPTNSMPNPLIISEESGPYSSLISRIRCEAFFLMIHTFEKRPMAGLETSIGIMPHENATPEETQMAAEIVWPITADRATKHRLHKLLTGALAEGYCKSRPVKEWQLGLGFEGAMFSMQKNGLVRSYSNRFPTDPFTDTETDTAGDATMPGDEDLPEEEDFQTLGSIAPSEERGPRFEETCDRLWSNVPNNAEASEESGPDGSLKSRAQCGEFYLIIRTEPRRTGGLETWIALGCNLDLSRAQFIWSPLIDRSSGRKLHRFLVASLREFHAIAPPKSEQALGLLIDGISAWLAKNNLLSSQIHSFNDPYLAGPFEFTVAKPRPVSRPTKAEPPSSECGEEESRNWQERVIEAFPNVGIAGTRENKSFVAEYKRRGTPETALDIACDLDTLDWPITIPSLEDLAPDVDNN